MSYLRIKNIGKAYKRYPYKWGRMAEWLGMGMHHEQRWVLQNVSFNVEPEEAVGIIGPNGAGKSTLLKIITGTTKPTTGTVEAGGRISALLELGMGFHPEFTGRQNAYMGAQIRGLTFAEINAKINEIEDFAEIGDYFDQPLRTYSTGMQVRLAFSVATCIRPDILIVDEALSVGDSYFQHKSFDRIRKFRDAGTTLLFVSHSPAAVKTLCNRAILLDEGILIKDDDPDVTLDYYNAMIARQRENQKILQEETEYGKKITRSGNNLATITAVELLSHGQPVRAIQTGESATIRVHVKVNENLEDLTVGILIRDRLGNDVFGTNTFHHNMKLRDLSAAESFCVDFHFTQLLIGRGSYSVTAALHTKDSHVCNNYDWWDRALVFQCIPGSGPHFEGVSSLPVNIQILPWKPSEPCK